MGGVGVEVLGVGVSECRGVGVSRCRGDECRGVGGVGVSTCRGAILSSGAQISHQTPGKRLGALGRFSQ